MGIDNLFGVRRDPNSSCGLTKILEPSDDEELVDDKLCDQKCDECEGCDGNCRCPGDCNNDCKVPGVDSDNDNCSPNHSCECGGNCGNGECHHNCQNHNH